jgi:DNA-directed RNA polymerase, beta subunit
VSERERAETAQTQPEQQTQPEAQNQPEVGSQPGGLTPVERRILEVERRRFKHQGSKEKAIIAAGFTPIAYYQRLNVMLDDERVRAAAPQIIDVLRARRDTD